MTTTTPFGATVRPMTTQSDITEISVVTAIQKFSPTVIELGASDLVVITKDGKVVGYVEVQRVRNGNTELLAHPVSFYGNFMAPTEETVFNSFATTLATNVDSLEDLSSAQNFIKFMNKEIA